MAIAKSIIVAAMYEELTIPYNSIVSSKLQASPECKATNLEFVY